MTEYLDARAALVTLLQAQDPARSVSRNLQDWEQMDLEGKLEAGHWTVVNGPITDFSDSPRVGEDGHQIIRLICVQRLAADADGAAVEAAEDNMLAVVLAVLKRTDLPRELQVMYLRECRQSGQLETPLAWAGFEIENWVTTNE